MSSVAPRLSLAVTSLADMALPATCVLVLSAVLCGSLAADSRYEENTAIPSGPVTKTPMGSIRGSWMETRRGRRFHAYRGVRYAEPPVGELRFQPPKPVTKYKEMVDASEDGPACPQVAPNDYYVDEDCLRLNVYTPDNDSSNLYPVIFFIHPGGFYSMNGRSDMAGPHYLLDRDVVLVTINYRISSLGFLSTGDEHAPGNNGMKDQVAALRWVRQNIAAFGGDPDSVTVAGVSAGSISAMLHMISPMTKGLFHRAISISGSATGKTPYPRHQMELAIKQAQILNCPTNSSKAIVDCLKTKHWKELGDSYPKFYEIGYDPVGLWGPVVERDFGQERYLAQDPTLAIQRGELHAVPHIISQTTDEFAWFAYNILKNETLLKQYNANFDKYAPISFLLPQENATAKVQRLKEVYLKGKPLANDEASAKGMGQLYVDSIEGFPVHRMASLMAKHSPKPVYFYELAYVGAHSHWEDPVTKKPVGAMHHDDMIYLFTLSYQFPTIELDTPDNDMVEKMTAIWYNFARTGNPNPQPDTPELGEVRWPALSHGRYLRVDEELTVHQYDNDRFKLWEELYPLKPWNVPA